MESCNMLYIVLTFESVNEILRYGHLNETSLAALLHGNILFSSIFQNKIWDFSLILMLALLAVKGIKHQGSKKKNYK